MKLASQYIDNTWTSNINNFYLISWYPSLYAGGTCFTVEVMVGSDGEGVWLIRSRIIIHIDYIFIISRLSSFEEHDMDCDG